MSLKPNMQDPKMYKNKIQYVEYIQTSIQNGWLKQSETTSHEGIAKHQHMLQWFTAKLTMLHHISWVTIDPSRAL